MRKEICQLSNRDVEVSPWVYDGGRVFPYSFHVLFYIHRSPFHHMKRTIEAIDRRQKLVKKNSAEKRVCIEIKTYDPAKRPTAHVLKSLCMAGINALAIIPIAQEFSQQIS